MEVHPNQPWRSALGYGSKPHLVASEDVAQDDDGDSDTSSLNGNVGGHRILAAQSDTSDDGLLHVALHPSAVDDKNTSTSHRSKRHCVPKPCRVCTA
eukprot:6480529-Amphidinium_carterae.1